MSGGQRSGKIDIYLGLTVGAFRLTKKKRLGPVHPRSSSRRTDEQKGRFPLQQAKGSVRLSWCRDACFIVFGPLVVEALPKFSVVVTAIACASTVDVGTEYGEKNNFSGCPANG